MKIRKQNNLVTRRTFASDQRPSCGLVERIVRHFFYWRVGFKVFTFKSILSACGVLEFVSRLIGQALAAVCRYKSNMAGTQLT